MQTQEFYATIGEIGRQCAQRARQYDDEDSFVAENYQALKQRKLFSAAVPEDLGGGGISHADMCRGLRALAADCGATALSFSMHQHLVLFQTWNHLHGKPGKAVLEKVAANQLVLISTGGRDFLESNGSMERVEGGYKVTATKRFASGCLGGDVLVTSAPFTDPKEGEQVLHFPVPLSSQGVKIRDDWHTMGMRGSGSNTVELNDVFVPEEAVAARRPRGVFNPMFQVIITVALAPIMAAYLGVADAAARIAREQAGRRESDPDVPYLIGEMETARTAAELAVEGMISNANNLNFEPSVQRADAALQRKTLAVKAIRETVDKALEAAGGSAYFRAVGLERLVRDSFAAQFHPLPEKKQAAFTGRAALGLDPIA